MILGKKLGAVIGAKGVNLKAIQETTGASISTPKGERDNTVPATVTVSGTKDAVAKATRAIKDLATKGYSKLIAGEDFQESSVMVNTDSYTLSYTLKYSLSHAQSSALSYTHLI